MIICLKLAWNAAPRATRYPACSGCQLLDRYRNVQMKDVLLQSPELLGSINRKGRGPTWGLGSLDNFDALPRILCTEKQG